MKYTRKLCALLLAVALISAIFPVIALAASLPPATPPGSYAALPDMQGRFLSHLSYKGPSQYLNDNHAWPDELFYYKSSQGNICMVSAYSSSGNISVFTYNPNTFAFIGRKNIPFGDFPLWGGFYQAPDGNFYIAVGRENAEEDDNKVVIEIRKYNAEWVLTGTAQIRSGTVESTSAPGITKPFDGGTCRMVLVGERLIVHTSREMNTNIYDGIIHQSNITFEIDTVTMQAYDMQHFGLSNLLCSHSFNQYVLKDGNDLLFIDHGDSLPTLGLQLSIMKNYAPDSGLRGAVKKEIFTFSGVTALKQTGTTVTGFETGQNGSLIVGSSKPHAKAINGVHGMNDGYSYNIYLIVLDKTNYDPTFKWITTYDPSSSAVTVEEPRLIKVSEDRFMLLFNEVRADQAHMEYRLLDSYGNTLASKSFNDAVFAAGSEPIIIGNNLHWARTDANNNWFAYIMDIQDLSSPEMVTIPVSSVGLNKTELTLTKGQSAILTHTILPANASNTNVTWKSSDESVATISAGSDGIRVTAKNYGQATIIATTKDGNKTAQCIVTVPTKPVQSVGINVGELKLEIGWTIPLSALFTPENATNKNVSWSSSDSSVASVGANGEVTGLKIGQATVTVTTDDGGLTAQCLVTVRAGNSTANVPVSGITMQSALILAKGKTATLTPTISPANASNKLVIWSSGNPSVATVSSSGQVKGVNSGTTTITATTDDGLKKASCSVKVTEPETTAPDGNLPKLSKEQFTYNLTAKTYNGKAQGITISPKSSVGKITAVYYNALTTVPAGAGSYTVTVDVAVGSNYNAINGLVLGTFKINKAGLSKVAVTIADMAWTGKQIKPAKFTYNGVSFTISTNATVKKYGANKNIGKGSIQINGKGNFTGTKTISFKIVPKTNSVSRITVGAKQMKVTWSKVSSAQKITKYEMRYRVKGTKTWTAKLYASSLSSTTIKSLITGKIYEVQVRSYKTVSGVKYYSAWSAVKTSGKIK